MKTERPKITVVTPSYNSAATIALTLDSVKQQSYSNIEHLIVDGASKDATLVVVGSHIRPGGHVISEPDRGIYDAMNKGLSNATGGVVGFLGSDDFFVDPSALSKVAAAFQDSSIKIFYADLNYVDRLTQKRIVRRWRSGDFSRLKFCMGWMPPHPTFYVRADLLKEVGFFKSEMRVAADYEFVARCLQKVKSYEIFYCPEVLVHMCLGGASNGSSLKGYVRTFREVYQAAKSAGLSFPFVALVSHSLRVLGQLLGGLIPRNKQ